MYRKRELEKKIVVALLLGLSCAGTSYAEKVDNGSDTPSFDLEAITVEAKRPDWESKLSPGTVTVIRPDDYKGEQKDLPELLKMVPGVHVRQLMGKGQYTTVSVRGSTAAQVGVFVDGVLYNLGGDAAVDISTIPVKNVERIEVYRGYIPARFGGTYIGGVINIVTKRPTKADVSASFGKSSYGGYKGSLEVDAPLGSGSLMVGVNREQSQGDFQYTNYYSDTTKAGVQTQIDGYQSQIDNASKTAVEYTFVTLGVTTLNGHDVNYYQNNLTAWNEYVNSSLYTDAYNYYSALSTSITTDTKGKIYCVNNSSDAYYAWVKTQLSASDLALITTALSQGSSAAIKAYMRSTNTAEYLRIYAEIKAYYEVAYSTVEGDGIAQAKAQIAKWEAQKKALGDGTRYRKYNDYKNTDFIAKWQDDHWLAKFSWKEVNRHLPGPTIWYNSPYGYMDTDVLDYPNAARKQVLTSKEALVGHRDTIGNLEWGWNINYLNQGKRYNCENWDELDALNPNNPYSSIPMRKWSAYDSTRWGGAVDGTYKAGKNNLLEFMVNYSDENMDVAGSGITDGTLQTGYSSANRYRTNYDQKLLNLQLQDTITLNAKGDLWLTPSIRYNRSEINSGRAVGWGNNAGTPAQWMFEAIDQTDSKATWQLALKKQVNDHLTLRTTGGTYYRLLNLYEIAGDGGSILPAPISSDSSVTGLKFPVPEEGKQYDISAIWDSRMLGADSKLQLTYFHRNADKLLMLWRYGYDYWSYTNSSKGKSNGIELQTDFNWKKWDLNLEATYLNTSAVRWDDSAAVGQSEATSYSVHQTYTPEWEGYLRLNYRPDKKTTFFGEVKYVDEMYISYYESSPDIQDSLTTVGLGIKHNFTKNLQLVVGCNDIFNSGPEIKCRSYRSDGSVSRVYNAEYPLQGRTYYTTLQYKF